MSGPTLGRWVTLAANLAVLVGIGLVVAELNQNRAAIQAQTRDTISSEVVALMSQVASGPTLSEIIRAADAGATLDSAQAFQYMHRTIAMYRYWEKVHYLYREGFYDQAEYSPQLAAIAASGYARNPTALQIWCSGRDLYSPEFRTTFDSLVATEC